MRNVVGRIGLGLAGFAAVVAALSLLWLPDPWLLIVSALTGVVGLLIAAGMVPRGRAARAVGVALAAPGIALIALGVMALIMGTYGPLIAMFLMPPGMGLLAIGLALIAVWRAGRAGGNAPAAVAASASRD